MKNVIYIITNLVNNRVYVGSAVDFPQRRQVHLHHLRKNKHHSPILQAAFNKYKEENFIFSILEKVKSKETLVSREQFYIDLLNPYYNCSPTAGSPLGVKHSDVSRKNMSDAHKALTKEQRNHKQNCNCFICAKRSSYWSGKTRTEETKEKLSIPIIQCDMKGNEIKEWFGASEAARSLGLIQSHISACCRNLYGRKSIGGFKWKFK